MSGSGPTVAFLARDAEHALDLSVALTASGGRRDRAAGRAARCTGRGSCRRDSSEASGGADGAPLGAEGVTRRLRGTRALLDDVSLGLDDGDRIGVVGRNGGGKSHAAARAGRRQAPDAGRVTQVGRAAPSACSARPTTSTRRRTSARPSSGTPPSTSGPATPRVRDVLTGLLGGLEPAVGGLDGRVGTVRRPAAAGARWPRPLVDGPRRPAARRADEPSRRRGRRLAGRPPAGPLAGGRGALVVVTHDRWFLDAVCERTWEVHDGVVDGYEGGYAAYVLARAERARHRRRRPQERRREPAAQGARLAAAGCRRRGRASRSSGSTRPTALIADEPPPRDRLALNAIATARLGKDVIDLEDVTVAAGRPRAARRRHLAARPGERVGIVGVNGSGKTSLLRLLPGELAPAAGRVRRGQDRRTAKLTQDVAELRPEVADLRVQRGRREGPAVGRLGDRDVTAGQLLERLGFAGERAVDAGQRAVRR